MADYPKTYSSAQHYLLEELKKLGWKTKPLLKVPQAISPNEEIQLFFNKQSVYLGKHSLFLDYRGMSVDTFLYHVHRAQAAP